MTRAAIARGIPWSLEDGGCAALPLPVDESIAAVARAQLRGLLPTLGLTVQDVRDVAVMVSELATNVLQHGMSGDPDPGAELWVYQRRDEGGRDELVVKAFDTRREWSDRAEPSGDLLEHGRGLRLVEVLANGRWGHHPSRSRLSYPAVRGKVTWFAVPVTRTSHGRRHPRQFDDPHAMRTLHSLLVQRGVDRLRPREDLGGTVMSDPRDLTVRCETSTFRWRARSGETGTLPVTDITEVCEQLVRLHESMDDRG